MIKKGNSTYIPVYYLNRLNQNPKQTKYIEKMMTILDYYYELKSKKLPAKIIEQKMQIKFKGVVWNKKNNIPEGLYFFGKIDPWIYYQTQKILQKLTGKLWPLEDIIKMLLQWFPKAYEYPLQQTKRPLPIVRKRKPAKRYDKVKLFHEKFSKYYKNISK